jgi:membrane-bound inhibitor of C-type lysozyme
MKKMVFIAAIIASFGLMMASCNGSKEKKSAQQDEIVTGAITNADGISLDYAFNNTQGTAIFVLNGDTIKMQQERMASGVKYKNDDYVYTEWQGNVTLQKGETIVFEKTNQILENSFTDQTGTILNLVINNETDMATIVLGDQTIELKRDTVASGLRFSNADGYVFTEHQGEIQLKKDDNLLFQYQKQ